MTNSKIIFALIFVFVSYAFASNVNFTFGVEGGVSYNNLNTSVGYRISTSYENMAGLTLGVPVLVSFHENVALGTGLRYIQKNYTYRRIFFDYYDYPMYSDFTNGFLQVPISANFSYEINGRRVFLDLGATLGYWLHSNASGAWIATHGGGMSYEPFSERVKFDGERDNRFDAALFCGAGYRFFRKTVSPFISVQYHYGLTDLQKDYMINQVARYNNTFLFQTGIFFGGKK